MGVESDGGGFRAGRPRVVVEDFERLFSVRNYSVDPNADRFLILTREDEGESGPDRVVVVVNWFDVLRRRH